ncbi:MAG: UDP-N-acetylmuramate dehydrogenase [Leptolinea sp.]
MSSPVLSPALMTSLREFFGDRLQENVVLANYTTAHVGGPADGLLVATSSHELEEIFTTLWSLQCPVYLLGSGSNVLVSDAGYRGVVVINHARNIKIDMHHTPPSVWAESGANLGGMARQVALRGLSGVEWAATVPGTMGGAVFGNAGAFESDTASNLKTAEILHQFEGKQVWSVEKLEYGYRTSWLKKNPGQVVILTARFELAEDHQEAVQARIDEFSARRRNSQPPGASMGSMFKNPARDHAGRLIDAAGLRGVRVGGAHISEKHANFFITDETATASDIWALIQISQSRVSEAFGVSLELEVELVGDFSASGKSTTNVRKYK